ncbi:ARM repeat-containing protein [Choiromyces venosus 120613-1]|uniref:Nucleolar protein 9 n=1 Tax=Choiromyces venosus 120613-1 TaxID=1336337 RepID=A0A3N4JLP0_9PEZI|nr:ARM repeat-containing protein [Choiromyces venosus 120613-1]
MPKEAKKRGRRAEKKRKEEAGKEQPESTPQVAAPAEEDLQFYGQYDGGGAGGEEDTQFYGLLDEGESEYFRKADEILELNQFGDGNERALFIANVWKEADGKELKIANSQGCSRLLEKLILMSSPSQLKSLWRKFTGHFLNLVQHRFASHCCEMLFQRSVGIVSKEMEDDYVDDTATDEIFASMESLFMYMLNELEPQLKHLCTDRFASHTIRGLLLLLSGQTVSSSDLVQSRKKEKITLSSDVAPIPESTEKIPVPQSFHDAVGKILAATAGSMSTEEIRSMAVHQIGSPTLQVLMKLEMGRSSSKEQKAKAASKEGTLLGKLTGVSTEEEKSDELESSSFFNNLLYDPVGSHLAEKIILYAPKKEFKKLYKTFFNGRIGSLARNETAGFVVQRILEKLEKHILEVALVEILPQVKGLIERSQVAVVKTLIDCCAKQGVEASGIAEAIASAYDCEPAELILRMIKLTPEDLTPKEEENSGKAKRDPSQRYGSLLAQSMLQLPGKFHGIISQRLVL